MSLSVFLLQEFLAFSSRPVTLEDILRVEGRGLDVREVEGREVEEREVEEREVEGRYPRGVEGEVEGRGVTEAGVEGKRDTQSGVKELSKSHQKVVFLSTWSADGKNTQVCIKVNMHTALNN